MKTKQILTLNTLLMFGSFVTAFAQGTAFTYQGQLQNNGSPANGLYDLKLLLFDASVGGNTVAGPVTNTAVAVTNGLFTTIIDFGPGVFTGGSNWLHIGVRTNGSSAFTGLLPNQQLTPTPYAIYAESANAAALSGTLPLAQLPGAVVTNNNAVSVNLSGAFTGNGTGLANVNAAQLNGLNATSFWKTNGNAGANPTNGAFLGTADNLPLEFHVNGARALRLEPGGASAQLGNGTSTGAPNVIGGSPVNYVASGVVGAVIGGGGATNYNGYSYSNSVSADLSFLGGGIVNSIQMEATYSVLCGGQNNSIQQIAQYSFLGGGWGNSIQQFGVGSVLGGGYYNSIQTNAYESFLGGGWGNSIQTGAYNSFLGGGNGNYIQTGAYNSFLGGGYYNYIQDDAFDSFLGGGYGNSIQSGAYASVLGGGFDNTISGTASTIAGGVYNIASGPGAFIGGGGSDDYYEQGNIASGGGSVIGGGVGNQASGSDSVIGGGYQNIASEEYVFIGGGESNSIQTSAAWSFLGGGSGNSIQQNAINSVLGGGWANSIQPSASYSVLGGGQQNTIQTNSYNSAIAGGANNTIKTNSSGATIAGGQHNGVGANAANAFVAGGYGNNANGNCAFAAGNYAVVNNANSFVWSDGSATTTSTANDSVTMRAGGGYYFYTSTGGVGASLLPTDTAWTVMCDRNAKKNFQPVDTVAVLEKLAAIPILQWNYKWQKDSDVPNIGPMAQDFKAAFYPGRDDKGISTLEFDGVELAAIEGLNQKLEETRQAVKAKDGEIQTLKQQNDSLAERLNVLEATVKQLAASK